MTISPLMVELFPIDTMDVQLQQTDLVDILKERGRPRRFFPGHECVWSRSSVKEERHENQKHF